MFGVMFMVDSSFDITDEDCDRYMDLERCRSECGCGWCDFDRIDMEGSCLSRTSDGCVNGNFINDITYQCHEKEIQFVNLGLIFLIISGVMTVITVITCIVDHFYWKMESDDERLFYQQIQD